MSKEIWKDIEGYEGLYQVSNMGRVKSLERKVPHWSGERTVKERILKLGMDRGGYLQVNLYACGKLKTHKVHLLVCEAFHDNLENKKDVNHINENKTDNRVCNLEWLTRKENINFGTRSARAGKAIAKTLSKPVGQYTLHGELIKVWQSTNEVERKTGFHRSSISRVANGNRKQAYNFIWKYVEEV